MNNTAFFRDSKDALEQVNGNDYFEVAKSYYNSSMYDDGYEVIADTADIAKSPVFNPVEKIVNISSTLTTMGSIEPVVDNAEEIKATLQSLGIDGVKFAMIRDLILGKSVMIEIQETKDALKPYVFAYYTADNYEVLSMGDTIYQCILTGNALVYDSEANEYSSVESEKKYIRNDDGSATITITIDGEETTENISVMPLVELTTPYDMKQLFYCIDRYNQFDSFMANIFEFAGEPKLVATGVAKVTDVDIENMQNNRYKAMQTFFTKNPDAKISVVETSGKACGAILQKQEEIKDNVMKLFPEYAISNALDGGNVGLETTKIRLTEVLSRVESLRETLGDGLNDLLGIIDMLNGKDRLDAYVKLTDMMDADIAMTLNSVVSALNAGIISKQSAMFQIKDLFIGEDVSKEIEKIQSEQSGVFAKLFGTNKTGGTK